MSPLVTHADLQLFFNISKGVASRLSVSKKVSIENIEINSNEK